MFGNYSKMEKVIFTVWMLFLKTTFSDEPPRSRYLPPSSGISSLSQSFIRTYSPPTSNVTFNFGFAPKKSVGLYKKMDFTSSDEDSVTTDAQDLDILKKNSYHYENKDSLLSSILRNNGYQNNIPTESDSIARRNEQFLQKYGAPAESSYSRETVPIFKSLPSFKSLDTSYLPQKSKMEINNKYGPPKDPESRSLSENTSYDFSYDVSSPDSGVSLGHKENNNGETAEGVYYQLLPDGRLQTVEYWADDNGFKPRISYEILHSPNSRSDSSFKDKSEGPY